MDLARLALRVACHFVADRRVTIARPFKAACYWTSTQQSRRIGLKEGEWDQECRRHL